MQSNLNCVGEAENLGQDTTVSLYDYMKSTEMFVREFDLLILFLKGKHYKQYNKADTR